jgi:hypothetical protein
MSVTWIVIIAAAVVFVLVAVLHRKAMLDHLESLPGERVLFEEDNIKVTQDGAPRSAVFFRCKVRVTNLRIITAQKVALRKNKYRLRHVIWYNRPGGEGVDLSKTLGSGYIEAEMALTKVTVDASGENPVVKIPLVGSVLTSNQTAVIHTKRPEEFRRIFISNT